MKSVANYGAGRETRTPKIKSEVSCVAIVK